MVKVYNVVLEWVCKGAQTVFLSVNEHQVRNSLSECTSVGDIIDTFSAHITATHSGQFYFELCMLTQLLTLIMLAYILNIYRDHNYKQVLFLMRNKISKFVFQCKYYVSLSDWKKFWYVGLKAFACDSFTLNLCLYLNFVSIVEKKGKYLWQWIPTLSSHCRNPSVGARKTYCWLNTGLKATP